jgi:8-oxo-dGTP pyrophosphatase MutT (NUDIX family)
VTRAVRARRWARLALMLALRYTPLPWGLKHRAIWLALPKSILVSVGVIPDSEGHVLMLRARYSGGWLLPGGALEAHEDPLSGLLRECREELGAADVTVEQLTGIYTSRDSRETYFAFRCAPLTAPPVLSEEHEAWTYVPRDEIRPSLGIIVRDALSEDGGPTIARLPRSRAARHRQGPDR